MRFGADYYPEHWPEERWETDARLMSEAGFNTVRLAEFAWSKMEPEQGRYEFDWLLRAIDILNRHGIQAVIGTPTAAPPAWLCTNKPQILRVDENRLPVPFGHRQQYCVNRPEYRDASYGMVAAMAERLGGHEGIIGWQIDNEFGPLCYCEECQRQFQEWLRGKYGTLGALEQAWGTVFWSQTYTDWRQIPLPWKIAGPPNPGLALDFRRFFSDCYASFQQRQIDIIREHSQQPITHNFMGIWPEVLNYQQLADQLDFVSWDNYPFGAADPVGVSACHDLTRGYLRRNFWIMEQMSGPGGWGDMAPSPKPGRIRAWTYHAIGRGADGIIYFRWRPCRSGTEQYWHGILNHDGTTNRRYAEIRRTREELTRIEDMLDGSEVKAEVAFVHDYDSRFAFHYQRSNPWFSYTNLFLSLYKGLHKRNIPVDILSSVSDLSGYRLVVAPALFVLTEENARKLRDYVEGGGTLVMTFRSAVKDETGIIFDEPLPGRLQDVFGATVREYHSPHQDETHRIRSADAGFEAETADASIWIDILEPNDAEVIARYDADFPSGEAAVTRGSFGEGCAYYIGTQPAPEFSEALMQMIARGAGVRSGPETPDGVEAAVRTGASGRLLILTNHTDKRQWVQRPEGFSTDAISGASAAEQVVLQPYGAAVLST